MTPLNSEIQTLWGHALVDFFIDSHCDEVARVHLFSCNEVDGQREGCAQHFPKSRQNLLLAANQERDGPLVADVNLVPS